MAQGIPQLPDHREWDQLSDGRENCHKKLHNALVIAVIDLIPVSQGKSVENAVGELCELLRELSLRKSVHDEQVHVQAADLIVIELHLSGVLELLALIVCHTGDKVVERLSAMVLVRLHKGHVLRQLPSYDLREHLVVLSCEHDVHIVIPRDEAAVAHRAQKRAGIQCVLDLVLSADPVDLL